MHDASDSTARSPSSNETSPAASGGSAAASTWLTSAIPECAADTGGVPAAAASAVTIPNASGNVLGITSASAAGTRRPTSSCSRRPLNAMLPAASVACFA